MSVRRRWRALVAGVRRHRIKLAFAALAASSVAMGVVLGFQVSATRHAVHDLAAVRVEGDRRQRENTKQICLAVNDVRGVVEVLVAGAVGLPLRSAKTSAERERIIAFNALLRRSLPALAPTDCLHLKKAG